MEHNTATWVVMAVVNGSGMGQLRLIVGIIDNTTLAIESRSTSISDATPLWWWSIRTIRSCSQGIDSRSPR